MSTHLCLGGVTRQPDSGYQLEQAVADLGLALGMETTKRAHRHITTDFGKWHLSPRTYPSFSLGLRVFIKKRMRAYMRNFDRVMVTYRDRRGPPVTDCNLPLQGSSSKRNKV